jgi:hypothetical protein
MYSTDFILFVTLGSTSYILFCLLNTLVNTSLNIFYAF